jgi:antitoxin component YwqK of YwqJK toxin-antitoxin module
MNRLTCISPWLVAMAAALLVCAGSVGVSSAAEEDDSTAGETIAPYTGPPIFLDEPEPQPAASLVEKRVDSDKYADGKVRVEREIARYSDNRFVADGFYREFFPNGEKFAEGQYKNGRQHGEWTYWYDNGQVCRKVTYREGQPDGSWDVHSADGAVIAKRSYKNGKRDGTWVVYDKTGKQPLREEQYSEGKADGTWKVWFPSGQLQTQMGFKQGNRHGAVLIWDEKGNKRAELNYVDGKVDGTATQWGADGQKVVQQYKDGKLVSEKKE